MSALGRKQTFVNVRKRPIAVIRRELAGFVAQKILNEAKARAKDEGSKGNVMLYVDTKQCCLTARRLGKNLVLSLIWEKGHANACQNRVLIRSGDEK